MVTLYSTNCPKCKVLAQKLTDAGIEFRISDDVDKMIQKGFMSAPLLDVDGKIMNFGEAIRWVSDKEG